MNKIKVGTAAFWYRDEIIAQVSVYAGESEDDLRVKAENDMELLNSDEISHLPFATMKIYPLEKKS